MKGRTERGLVMAVGVALVLCAASACVGPGYSHDPVRVTVSDIRVLEATLLEQRYQVTLRVQNRDERALEIRGGSFDLVINGVDFGSGVTDQGLDIPAYSDAKLDVRMISTAFGMLRLIQGLQARICWLGYRERDRLGLAFNEMVRDGTLKAPIVIGRDHLDSGSVASPYRETEGMKDGSDAIADWPLLNAMLNTASGAAWVAVHHGDHRGGDLGQRPVLALGADVHVAGRGGGTINTGQHLRSSMNTPLNNLWLAVLSAMEVPMERFGNSTERLTGVLSSSNL